MSRPVEAERFRVAVELASTGIALHRQGLRRAHPDRSEAEIDAMLDRWLLERPPDVASG